MMTHEKVTTNSYTTLQPFISLFSRRNRANRYQKGKINLDLNEATDDGFLG